jgi:hypothetical protein
VIKKIGLSLVLMTMAGVASAAGGKSGDCTDFFGFSFCAPTFQHGPGYQSGPAAAPEMDPSSAMAGFTLLAGGLAVLRGRRSKVSKE